MKRLYVVSDVGETRRAMRGNDRPLYAVAQSPIFGTMVEPKTIRVTIARDADSPVWYVVESDLDGLFAEADSFDAMRELLPELAADLLADDANAKPPVTVEIVARTAASFVPAAA